MFFQSEGRKISRIVNKQITQSSSIAEQALKNKQVQSAYESIVPTQSVYQGTTKLFENDWQMMDVAITFEDIPLDASFMCAQYKNWKFELNRFDERLIPLINVEILVRPFGRMNDSATLPMRYKNVVFQIEDIPGEKYIKKVTFRMSILFYDPTITSPYESKLIADFKNPINMH